MVRFNHSNNPTPLVPIFYISQFSIALTIYLTEMHKGKKDLFFLMVSEVLIHAWSALLFWGKGKEEHHSGKGRGRARLIT
jgi:hypothetical protein